MHLVLKDWYSQPVHLIESVGTEWEEESWKGDTPKGQRCVGRLLSQQMGYVQNELGQLWVKDVRQEKEAVS